MSDCIHKKILISHRGNIDGRIPSQENKPDAIDYAISKGYDVEIDVRFLNDTILLGHDYAQYAIDYKWLSSRRSKLWIHCKNIEMMCFLNQLEIDTLVRFNYFWHEEDRVTLTSLKYIWAYPGKQPIKNSIAVLPELFHDDTVDCIGICSDNIERYLHE